MTLIFLLDLMDVFCFKFIYRDETSNQYRYPRAPPHGVRSLLPAKRTVCCGKVLEAVLKLHHLTLGLVYFAIIDCFAFGWPGKSLIGYLSKSSAPVEPPPQPQQAWFAV